MLSSEISPPSAHQLVQGCEKEDDATITSSEKGRIFTCPYALEVPLRKVGTAEDLLKLRQVNRNSYEMLNRPCMDLAKVVMLLGPKNPDPTVDSEDEEEDEIKVYNNPIPSSEFVLVSTHKDASTKTLHGQLIPTAQVSKLKHIYRSFIFSHYTLDDKMIKICTELSPYITNLGMMKFSDLKNWSLTSFINQFAMLKEIRLFLQAYNMNQQNSKMPFELDLDSLKSNPKITMYVSSWHEEILTKFGTHPNTYFELEIVRYQNQLTPLQQFEILSTKFGHLKNLKFSKFAFDHEDVDSIDNLHDLKLVTRLWLKHGKHINKLEFHFDFSPTTPEDENDVKECFTSLSSFITGLRMIGNFSSKAQIINLSCEWSKLVMLEIYVHGDELPMEILTHCPKLERLVLCGFAQDVCFFSNDQRSYEESLNYYFGNLTKLEGLIMHWQNGNIIREHHLDNYLQGLLPALQEYQNITPNH